MVSHTRRRFLHVAAAAAGGLAGCGELTTGDAQSTRSSTPAAEPNRPASDRATDPPRILVRAATDRPPIRLPNPDRESPEPYERDRLTLHDSNAVVDSQSRADRLVVADGVDDVTVSGGAGDDDGAGNGDAGESVAAFVDETEFDSQTLYLESNRVRECFRLQLCEVSWQPTEIRTDYTRQLRPYDERCGSEAYVVESRLIRLPVALAEDEVNSYGSSVGGSGHCDPRDGARAEGGGDVGHSELSSGDSSTGTNGGERTDANATSDSSTPSGQTTTGGEQ